jgi:predicted RNase H-like nuclease (RuvC/YqgF family)
MADQSTSEPMVPLPPVTEARERHDQPDLTGQKVLSLVHQASDLAGGNSRYAVEIAKKLSDQLCKAENRVEELEARITDLEAEVKFYRDKSEKAELWLGKISNEIQERVLGSDN